MNLIDKLCFLSLEMIQNDRLEIIIVTYIYILIGPIQNLCLFEMSAAKKNMSLNIINIFSLCMISFKSSHISFTFSYFV